MCAKVARAAAPSASGQKATVLPANTGSDAVPAEADSRTLGADRQCHAYRVGASSLLGQACLALALAASVSACSSGPSAPDDAGYVSELTAARLEKDRTFREEADPVPADKKDVLLPLPYFPVDPRYSVPAALRLADERPVFDMPTSTGTLRKYQLVGAVEFTLEGQAMSLGAFVENGQAITTLFVPFADATTGTETYSAGRYLDLHPTASGLYTLDFNRAYNPYCAYNSRYECPFPPPSNRLKVPIRAGEKVPGA